MNSLPNRPQFLLARLKVLNQTMRTKKCIKNIDFWLSYESLKLAIFIGLQKRIFRFGGDCRPDDAIISNEIPTYIFLRKCYNYLIVVPF